MLTNERIRALAALDREALIDLMLLARGTFASVSPPATTDPDLRDLLEEVQRRSAARPVGMYERQTWEAPC